MARNLCFSDHKMNEKLKNLSSDEREFVDTADLSKTDNLKRFEKLCEKLNYNGLWLKFWFARDFGLYVGKFLSETTEEIEVEDEDGKRVTKLHHDGDTAEDEKKRTKGQVIFIGTGPSPKAGAPKLSVLRVMNGDRVKSDKPEEDQEPETEHVQTEHNSSPKKRRTGEPTVKRARPVAATDSDDESQSSKRLKTINEEDAMIPVPAPPPPRPAKVKGKDVGMTGGKHPAPAKHPSTGGKDKSIPPVPGANPSPLKQANRTVSSNLMSQMGNKKSSNPLDIVSRARGGLGSDDL